MNPQDTRTPVTINGRFVNEFLSAKAPCFAMGLLEEEQRTRGFFALRLDEAIQDDGSGVGIAHQMLCFDDAFEIARFSFDLFGVKAWHGLVNPASPVVRRVLGIMAVSADYCIFLVDANGESSMFRSRFGPEDLIGLQANLPRLLQSTTSKALYEQVLADFCEDNSTAPMMNWVCRDNTEHLDLSQDRLILMPA